MAFDMQKKDTLETGKFPVMTVIGTKTAGASTALTRGTVVKLASTKVLAYAKGDTDTDIFGIVAHDVSDSGTQVIVYITGSFNLSSITLTGRTAAATKTYLTTTKFDDLRKLGLFFESVQSTTDSF